jgi:hypothetical protein
LYAVALRHPIPSPASEWVEKISRDLTDAIEQQRRVVEYLFALTTDTPYDHVAALYARDDAAAVLRKLEGK